jgi:hypothetical protein
MNIRQLLGATLAFALPVIAYAGPSTPALPEPETMALLGIGAVALVVARWRKKK